MMGNDTARPDALMATGKDGLVTRALRPDDWPVVEALFGARGACGGCWCMSWRTPTRDWAATKGAKAKSAFRELVASGTQKGILAFANGEPVGWCNIGPRVDYARLAAARSLAAPDTDGVWAIPCFFVKASHRGQGVAGRLLAEAVAEIGRLGGRVAEGYPVNTAKQVDGARQPPPFVHSGTSGLFAKQGFVVVGNPGGGRERVRKIAGGTHREVTPGQSPRAGKT